MGIPGVVKKIGVRSGVAVLVVNGKTERARFLKQPFFEFCRENGYSPNLEVGMEVFLVNVTPSTCRPELKQGIGFTADCKLRVSPTNPMPCLPPRDALPARSPSVGSTVSSPLVQQLNTTQTIEGIVVMVIKHAAGKVPRIVRTTIRRVERYVFIHVSDITVKGVPLQQFTATELLKWEVGMPVALTKLNPYSANGCTFQAAIDIDVMQNGSGDSQAEEDPPIWGMPAIVVSVRAKSGVAVFVLDKEEAMARFGRQCCFQEGRLVPQDLPLTTLLKVGMSVVLTHLAPLSNETEILRGILFEADANIDCLNQSNPRTESETDSEEFINVNKMSDDVLGIVCSTMSHTKKARVPRKVKAIIDGKKYLVFIHKSDITINGVKLNKFPTPELLTCEEGMSVVLRNLQPYHSNNCTYKAKADLDFNYFSNIQLSNKTLVPVLDIDSSVENITLPDIVEGIVTTVVKYGEGTIPLVVEAIINNETQNIFIRTSGITVNGMCLKYITSTELLKCEVGMPVEMTNLIPYCDSLLFTYEATIDIVLKSDTSSGTEEDLAPDEEVPAVVVYVCPSSGGVAAFCKEDKQRQLACFGNQCRLPDGSLVPKEKELTSFLEVSTDVLLTNMTRLEDEADDQSDVKFRADVKLLDFSIEPNVRSQTLPATEEILNIQLPPETAFEFGFETVSSNAIQTLADTKDSSDIQQSPETVVGIVDETSKHKEGKVPRIIDAVVDGQLHRVFISKGNIQVNGRKLKEIDTTELLVCNEGMPVVMRNIQLYGANNCAYKATVDLVLEVPAREESKYIGSVTMLDSFAKSGVVEVQHRNSHTTTIHFQVIKVFVNQREMNVEYLNFDFVLGVGSFIALTGTVFSNVFQHSSISTDVDMYLELDDWNGQSEGMTRFLCANGKAYYDVTEIESLLENMETYVDESQSKALPSLIVEGDSFETEHTGEMLVHSSGNGSCSKHGLTIGDATLLDNTVIGVDPAQGNCPCDPPNAIHKIASEDNHSAIITLDQKEEPSPINSDIQEELVNICNLTNEFVVDSSNYGVISSLQDGTNNSYNTISFLLDGKKEYALFDVNKVKINGFELTHNSALKLNLWVGMPVKVCFLVAHFDGDFKFLASIDVDDSSVQQPCSPTNFQEVVSAPSESSDGLVIGQEYDGKILSFRESCPLGIATFTHANCIYVGHFVVEVLAINDRPISLKFVGALACTGMAVKLRPTLLSVSRAYTFKATARIEMTFKEFETAFYKNEDKIMSSNKKLPCSKHSVHIGTVLSIAKGNCGIPYPQEVSIVVKQSKKIISIDEKNVTINGFCLSTYLGLLPDDYINVGDNVELTDLTPFGSTGLVSTTYVYEGSIVINNESLSLKVLLLNLQNYEIEPRYVKSVTVSSENISRAISFSDMSTGSSTHVCITESSASVNIAKELFNLIKQYEAKDQTTPNLHKEHNNIVVTHSYGIVAQDKEPYKVLFMFDGKAEIGFFHQNTITVNGSTLLENGGLKVELFVGMRVKVQIHIGLKYFKYVALIDLDKSGLLVAIDTDSWPASSLPNLSSWSADTSFISEITFLPGALHKQEDQHVCEEQSNNAGISATCQLGDTDERDEAYNTLVGIERDLKTEMVDTRVGPNLLKYDEVTSNTTTTEPAAEHDLNKCGTTNSLLHGQARLHLGATTSAESTSLYWEIVSVTDDDARRPSDKGETSNFHVPQTTLPGATVAAQAKLPEPSTKVAVQAKLTEPSTKVAVQAKLPEPSSKVSAQAKLPEPSSKVAVQAKLPEPSSKVLAQAKLLEASVKGAAHAKLPRPEAKGAAQAKLPEPSSKVAAQAKLLEASSKVAAQAKLPEPSSKVSAQAKLLEASVKGAAHAKLPQPKAKVAAQAKLTEPSTKVAVQAKLTEPSTKVAVQAKLTEPSTKVAVQAKLPEPSSKVSAQAKLPEPSSKVSAQAKLLEASVKGAAHAKLPRPKAKVAAQAKLTEPSLKVAVQAKLTEPSTKVAVQAKLPEPSSKVSAQAKLPEPSSKVAVQAKLPEPSSKVSAQAKLLEASVKGAAHAKLPRPKAKVAAQAKLTEPSTKVAVQAKLTEPSTKVAVQAKLTEPSTKVAVQAKLPEPSSKVSAQAKLPEPSSKVAVQAKLPEPSSKVSAQAKLLEASVKGAAHAKLPRPEAKVAAQAKLPEPSSKVSAKAKLPEPSLKVAAQAKLLEASVKGAAQAKLLEASVKGAAHAKLPRPEAKVAAQAKLLEPSSKVSAQAKLPEPSSKVAAQAKLLEASVKGAAHAKLPRPEAKVAAQAKLPEPSSKVAAQAKLPEPSSKVAAQAKLLEASVKGAAHAKLPRPEAKVAAQAKLPEPSSKVAAQAKLPEPSSKVAAQAKLPEPSLKVAAQAKLLEASVKGAAQAKLLEASVKGAAHAKLPRPEAKVAAQAKLLEPSSKVSAQAKLPEPSSKVAAQAKLLEARVKGAAHAKLPRPEAKVAAQAKLPEPSSKVAAQAKLPEPSSKVAAQAKLLEASVKGAAHAKLPRPEAKVAAQAKLPEPSSKVAAQAKLPEPSSKVAAQAKLPEPSSKVSAQAKLPEPSSKVAAQAKLPEPSSKVSAQAKLPEPSSKVAAQALLPEPSSKVSAQAKLPEPSSKVAAQAKLLEASVKGAAHAKLPRPEAKVGAQAKLPETKCAPKGTVARAKVMCSAGSQTLVTGDIVTYSLYHGI